MSDVFDRRWSLAVDGVQVVEPMADSLKCTFDIVHEFGGVIAYSVINIYNLSKQTVSQHLKKGSLLIFSAGYADNLGQVFNGTIVNVNTVRDDTNLITKITCTSGNKSRTKNVIASKTFAANTKPIGVIKYCVSQLGYAISIRDSDFSSEQSTTSPYAVFGDGIELLNSLSYTYKFDWTIEADTIVIIKKKSFRDGATILVSRETGMEDRPEYSEVGYVVKVRLNPKLRIGGRVDIQSDFRDFNFGALHFKEIPESVGNGVYTIKKITIKGDTHGNDWTSRIEGHTI